MGTNFVRGWRLFPAIHDLQKRLQVILVKLKDHLVGPNLEDKWPINSVDAIEILWTLTAIRT
jgi:hypothetical protein